MGSMKEQIYHRSPAWLQNILVSAYGYQLYQKRYTGVFQELCTLLEETRSWGRYQTEAWQSEKLHNMVKYCRETVPYYQKLFAEHGLHENDFTRVKDIEKLPVLTKTTLRENYSAFRSSQAAPYMVQHTSGSTGTPLALEVDEYTYKLAMALLVDHEKYHGVPFGARRATFAGRMVQPANNMNAPFSRYNWAENQRLFSSYHLNNQTFPEYKKELDKFSPQEIIGYPSAISDLAAHYLEAQQSPEFKPTAIITNSETLLSWQREQIEKVFHCQVFDYYGTAEYVAFAGQDKSGLYRVNPIIGLLEIATVGRQTEAEGPLIATTLTNKAMPLLRYELGDNASTKLAENSTLAHTLKNVIGRIDDYIVTPDGRYIGRIDHIFKGLSEIREAQVIQDRHNHCTIKIVASGGLSKQGRTKLSKNITSRLGPSISFNIEEVSAIPRGANGKLKNVIKELSSK